MGRGTENPHGRGKRLAIRAVATAAALAAAAGCASADTGKSHTAADVKPLPAPTRLVTISGPTLWSGYGIRLGATADEISGKLKVPAVDCATGFSFSHGSGVGQSSEWIGGSSIPDSKVGKKVKIIQTGVTITCFDGQTKYTPWTEETPAGERRGNLGTIKPGDILTAVIKRVGDRDVYKLTDQRTGRSISASDPLVPLNDEYGIYERKTAVVQPFTGAAITDMTAKKDNRDISLKDPTGQTVFRYITTSETPGYVGKPLVDPGPLAKNNTKFRLLRGVPPYVLS